MQAYTDFLRDILQNGAARGDRTGTGTVGVFGRSMRFNLAEGFPLLTTKKVHFHSVLHELLWFIRGEGNVAYLQENGVSIWDEWADERGELGPVYGVQWRSWPLPNGGHIDQLANVIEEIKANPNSRRLIVSAWNVAEIENMALPPCHLLFQFHVQDGKLSLQIYQRSADAFLGVPFNIASYALLCIMVAHECGLTPHELIWVGGDCHIYNNHVEAVREQLSREPRALPRLSIREGAPSFFEMTAGDILLSNYNPHPRIPAEVSV